MKITHYICPRNCGKTTFAKELQMKDPENTLLYTMEHGAWSWGQSMRGERWKRIIMDEYILRYNKLSEVDKHRFIDWIKKDVMPRLIQSDGELVLISTSDQLYNSLLFLFLSQGIDNENRIMDRFKYSPVLNLIDKRYIENLKKEIEEMRDKFLAPSIFGLEIIKTDFGHNYILLKVSEYSRFKDYKNIFGEERYKLDIEGEFLK